MGESNGVHGYLMNLKLTNPLVQRFPPDTRESVGRQLPEFEDGFIDRPRDWPSFVCSYMILPAENRTCVEELHG